MLTSDDSRRDSLGDVSYALFPSDKLGLGSRPNDAGVLPVGDTRIAVFVSSITSKQDLPPTLPETLRSQLRNQVTNSVSPLEALKALNARMAPDLPQGVIVTVTLGVLDATSGRLELCSAGHNPLVVYRHTTRKIGLLAPKGAGVGREASSFNELIRPTTLQMVPGDRLVLHTEQFMQAFGGPAEGFSNGWFYKFVRDNADGSSSDFISALERKLHALSAASHRLDEGALVTLGLTPHSS
jgi:sigma-B regulation protein RsbU (phosphoserine phosphatase)